MKWRNQSGKQADAITERDKLVGVYRKCFAWWPVDVEGGDTIWWEPYYKVLKHIPTRQVVGGLYNEYNVKEVGEL